MKKLINFIVFVMIMCMFFSGCVRQNTDENMLNIAISETGKGREWLIKVLEAYKEDVNPNLKYEIDGDPELNTSLQTILSSQDDRIFDVCFVLETNLALFAANDYIISLDDLYDKEMENGVTYKDKVKADFVNYFRVNTKNGEHFYGTPLSENVNGFVYNNKIFEKYGLLVPSTIPELLELIKDINNLPVNDDTNPDNDIAPFAWGGAIASYWDFPVQEWWVQQIGVDNFKKFLEFESADVFHPASENMIALRAALTQFQSLVTGPNNTFINSTPGAMSDNHISSQMKFINGKAAMIPCGSWIETEMSTVLNPEICEMKMMLAPFMENAKKDENNNYIPINHTAASESCLIPQKAKNKELAKDFLRYMATDTALNIYVKETGIMRPFNFEIEEGIYNNASVFTKSVIDIWSSSVNIYRISDNPLYKFGKLTAWPTGKPFASLLTTVNRNTPAAVISSNYNYVNSNWQSWKEQLGISD